MKKILSTFIIIMFSISTVFAYDLSIKDKASLNKLQPVLERVYTQDNQKFQDILVRINDILPKLELNTRSYELVYQLRNIMNDISVEKEVTIVEDLEAIFTLIKVIDWDTVTLNNSTLWEDITYRLIWIDAPETSAFRFWEVEQYWKESREYLLSLLEWGDIQVEYDDSQWKIDSYDRDLVYIFAGWVNVNKEMVAKWYAKEYTYDKPYKYQSDFKQAEKQAQEKESWVWWLKEKEETNVYSWFTDTQSDGVCNIKWNISSKWEKIYHYEWCQSYTRTKISPEKWERYFCSTKEAENAWWRVAWNCN